MKAIISGGGTGGHIFPALSIAGGLKRVDPKTEILFVGANGRMEMEKVPAAGYEIKGLNIAGLQRGKILANLGLPFKVIGSVLEARRIIKEFKPDVVIGVGGYASAPLLYAAQKLGIPTLIQEQNGFAGLTNKIIGKKAQSICVAYEGMERFFPAERIVFSGNPTRENIVRPTAEQKAEAIKFYGLSEGKKYVFVVGGSLGCRTMNNTVREWILAGIPSDIEIIWQCGKRYKAESDAFMAEHPCPQVHHFDFIARMDLAYAAADIVVSRSGASSVSELCIVGKPVIFVPSPVVAEDHQTHNAMALVRKDAALIVKDAEAVATLPGKIVETLADEALCAKLSENILRLAKLDSVEILTKEAYRVAGIEFPQQVYFIGIGGIGMSAIARYYKSKGWSVSGYDKTPSTLTRELEAEGISVHYEDRPDLIPSKALIVYTPAIPHELGEMQRVFAGGYQVVKRSQILGEISRSQICLAVAGTHGKTTTSTLLAHILHNAGGCNAILGGISCNYGTNLLLSDVNLIVTEADEFDRSFHTLHPDIAIITAMDADHLDIYGTHENVIIAFKQFAKQVKEAIILKHGLDITSKDTAAEIYTYSLDNPEADFYAHDFTPDEAGCFTYTMETPRGAFECHLGVLGLTNVENAVAAAAAALQFGVSREKICENLATFRGVKRRFEIHNEAPVVYVDDYAHHPAELASAIRSLRGSFPGRKLTAIFQPHLYTRTRDFAPEFAESLSAVDELILLDIYPAREEPIEGVTSKIIFDAVTLENKQMMAKEDVVSWVAAHKGELDVLITFGAGNIDRLIPEISKTLAE